MDAESRLLDPPPWAVMVAAAVGLAVGPGVIALGSGGQFADRLAASGPFALWVALLGVQTVVWLLASVPLALAVRRHWTSEPRPDAAARGHAVAAAIVLALLIASVPVTTALTAGDVPELVTHARVKIRALVVVAGVVALVAAFAVWLIRGRLQRLPETGPTKESLRTYLELRADLERLLGYLGAVVGLAVVSSAALRRAVVDADARAAADFPPEAVILYGAALSLILALVYLPTHLAAQRVGAQLREALAPFPEPARLAEGMAERRKLDDVLGLSVSTSASFRAGVAILAPLLGSLTSLLPALG